MTLALMCVAASMAGGAATAPQTDGPPFDPAAILADLDKLRATRAKAENERREAVMRELQQGAGDDAAAVALFSAATREMEFAGVDRERSKFQDWKGKESANLKNKYFRGALRLQFQYLAATLRVAWGQDRRELLPFLKAHLEAVTRFQAESDADLERIDRRLKMTLMHGQLEELREEKAGLQAATRLLAEPVSRFFYVAWRQLDAAVAKAKDWPLSASDVDGLFRLGILPQLRDAKDPALATAWDQRIQLLQAAAARGGRAFDQTVFDRTRLPDLLWQKAEDLLAIGQRNNAVRLMHAVVMGRQDAPQSDKWISTLEGIVRKP